jgi:hypothetical protein
MSFARLVCTCARVVALTLLFAPVSAQAEVITVPAGGDLQAALDAARPGDTIHLAPGATYVGNFKLPVHGGTTYVTVRTGGSDALLPPAGTRISPAYAKYLARIKSPNNAPALATRAGAAFWRVMLLELGPNLKGQGDVVALGSGSTAQNSLSLVPHHLILDRVYVHGDPYHGQKRGIAINGANITIVNSYVSEIKAVGQDTQAIAGWNGPGPFHIENNYLEAGAEVFLLGGDDPKIPNLVPSDLLFRGNVLTRPVAWRNAIVSTPSGVTATAGSGGTLLAGTYAYRVVARRPAGATTATSARSAEVAATVGAGGQVTIRWTAVADATEYRVYGRGVGSQTMYWTVTGTSFTDTGAAGTAGTPPASGTVWQVKNIFELKNARRVQIDYNLMENNWRQAQAGMAVLFTVRNQYGGCLWCVVEDVTFEYNVVRHVGGGVHIMGVDYNFPSQQTNGIRIRHNEFSDVDRSWGGSAYVFLLNDDPRDITIDHNTMISNSGSGIVSVEGAPVTGFVFTNNVARHNSYGIFGASMSFGNNAINHYFPGAVIQRNVIAGGRASLYPADNLFPTTTDFAAHFVDYAGGGFALKPGTDWAGAGLDSKDLGADYDEIRRVRPVPSAQPLRATTESLPAGVENDPYSATLEAAGGTAPYRWSLLEGVLPAGLALNPLTGAISGVPSVSGDFVFTVKVTDSRGATATQPLALHLDRAIPPVEIVTQWVAKGQAQVPYSQHLEAVGGLGTYSWNLSGGTLPAGVTLTASGDLLGTPATAGDFAFTVTVEDAADPLRHSSRTFVLSVAPPPNKKPTVSLTVPAGPVSVGAPVRFVATASDTDGVVQRVDFFVNGLVAGSDTAAPFQVDWVARDGGPHVITAVATDNDGASATSNAASIAVTAEVVIYASDVKKMVGNYQLVADSTAANGQRLWNPNKGTAKLGISANPLNYAEFTFYAEAGRAYHIWMRGKADQNAWPNDSAFLQFSGTVNAMGTPVYRIGTTDSHWYSLEEGTSVGVSGWGWQDNGFGVGVMGAHLYFERTGLQTIRIQQREDGLSIDQIVISPAKHLVASPGLPKNDATIISR